VIERSSVTWRNRTDPGSVEWGYYVAAVLHDWEFSGTAERGFITGPATSLDTFRLSQRPLVFTVVKPKMVWRWPILELQQHGQTLTLTVGPCEE
jgi:hypothetical protein